MSQYPSEDELEKIRQWDSFKDPMGLIEFIESLFMEYGTIKKSGKRVKTIYMATGGWSGNEDIITAMQRNSFWYLYWQKSERGGAYTFKIGGRLG